MSEQDVMTLSARDIQVMLTTITENSIFDPASLRSSGEMAPLNVIMTVADTLQWPMASVYLKAQVGRIYLVNYEPVRGIDPDLITVVGNSQADIAFRTAVCQFQGFRRMTHMNPGRWFQEAKEKVKEFIVPLAMLKPAWEEAVFVSNYLNTIVYQCLRINDGIRYEQARQAVGQYSMPHQWAEQRQVRDTWHMTEQDIENAMYERMAYYDGTGQL